MSKIIILLTPIFLFILELVASPFASLGLTDQHKIIFLFVWMITWWISEVAPLGITSLIPFFYVTLFDIVPIKNLASFYADPLIFLFLGGFALSYALEKTELSERFSLSILKITGGSDRGIVLGFLISTAVLSMWISNTATTMMMLPIALSVVNFLKTHVNTTDKSHFKKFSVVLFLTISYASSIGGTMTPIGTPPNVVLLGYLEEIYKINLDFWLWMLIMCPVAMAMLVLQYFLLNKLFPYKIEIPREFVRFVSDRLKKIGPINSSQKMTLITFALTALLWITKDLINRAIGKSLFHDANIAIIGACILFFIPHDWKKFSRVLDDRDISHISWNILLLFGGGMALTGSMEKVGLLDSFVSWLGQVPIPSVYLFIALIATITVALTEVMSNVALCMVALPLIMSLGKAHGISPLLIGMVATICASYGFCLPMSTPPNAIVFGTNQIRVKDMIRAGLFLNLFGIITIMTIGWFMMHLLLPKV